MYIVVGYDVNNNDLIQKFCSCMNEVFGFVHNYQDEEIVGFRVYKEMNLFDE